MKFLTILRDYQYGESRGEIFYVINLEDVIYFETDVNPSTNEFVLITRKHEFRGLVINFKWVDFFEFLSNEKTKFNLCICDNHKLFPGNEDDSDEDDDKG